MALLLATQVIRNAVVAKYAENNPERAARFWAYHPAVEISQGLVQIATGARQSGPTNSAIFDRINDAARKSPLSAEPFLVRGIQAHLSGNDDLAGRAYRAAELRDGRSVPARYFLADYYLRTGNVPAGLGEIGMLARMIPTGVGALSPYLANFAQDARYRAQLKALFRSQPQLEDATLSVLAADPRNTELVLGLANPGQTNPAPSWPSRLVTVLVNDRQYARAYDVWRSAAHGPATSGALIYDMTFADATAPPPFNWTLTSSTVGLAERQLGGKLHVVYEGVDDGVLAWQMLLLKPGRYRLAMRVAGDFGKSGALGWTLTCANSSRQLFNTSLAPATMTSFTVPPGCAAQRLELAGSAGDVPQTSDVTITGLSLSRERPNG